MKRMFYCVHYIIIDSEGYYESIKACTSKETIDFIKHNTPEEASREAEEKQ